MPVLGFSVPTVTTVPIGWYDVTAYGAVGNFTADDTAAIQAAVNALKARTNGVTASNGGQVLYFPAGYYKTTATLDMTNLGDVTIKGWSAKGGWSAPAANPATSIAISHTGARGIDMRGSHSCLWDGVSVVGRAAGSTGVMLDMDSPTTQTHIDNNRIANCAFQAIESQPVAYISLAGHICATVDNVMFVGGGTNQVRMVNTSAPSTFCNANSIKSCVFLGNRTNSILNPGPQTTIIDCTFEPRGDHTAAPILINQIGNEDMSTLCIVGTGFWDNTTGNIPWIKSTVATSAMSITGCKFTVSPTGSAISLSNHTGLSIQGSRFDTTSGTPTVFDPAFTITNGSMLGCQVKTPVVDNKASVFV